VSAGNREGGGKRLLPEVLPAPSPVAAALTPAERVAARARLFLQRFRALGPTAGAAVLSLQCGGYGVVDPLPPPPGQCSSVADPFPVLSPFAVTDTSRQGDVVPVRFHLRTSAFSPGNLIGFRIDAVRVTGGTLVKVEDVSQTSGVSATDLMMVLLPESASTMSMTAEVDLGCGGATATKRYQLMFVNVVNETVTVTELSAADGGP
jgi:hypothetical protein